MATLLTDAAIRIALDPRLAKDELNKLSQEIDQIEKDKQEQARGLDQLEQRAKDQGDAFRRSNSGAPGPRSGTSLVDTVKAVVGKALSIGENLLPQVGQAIASGAKDTLLEPYAEEINKKIQELANRVTEVTSKVAAALPTVEQTIQYNIAALRLGGRFPSEQTEIVRQIFTITSEQERLRRSIDRDIDLGTIDSVMKAAKAFVAGGR